MQLAATISLRSHRHSSPPRTDGGCGVACGRLEPLFDGSSNAARSHCPSSHRSSFRRRRRKVSYSLLLSSFSFVVSSVRALSVFAGSSHSSAPSLPFLPRCQEALLSGIIFSCFVQKKLCLGLDEAAGVPIEPDSQTKLLDATLNLEGVLLARVLGAGEFDAVFAVTLGDSSSNMTKIWSLLNVI
ncbi:Putative phosphomevalonate kinase [Arachis hypogaea]|nr:Putative phosphomevalonate kinase [Arachis hypogaea]